MQESVETKEQKQEVEIIETILADAIIERPISFSTKDGRFYFLYQPSLGIQLISEPILKSLDFDESFMQVAGTLEMIRVIRDKRAEILRLVAYHTFKRRSDAAEEDMVLKRIKELDDIFDDSELMTVFSYILSWTTWTKKLMRHFMLDMEKQRKQKAQEGTKSDSGLVFGGRSIYGSMIDFACERYGWQFGYVVWGLSLTNLNMMMSDAVTSMYMSKEDMRKLGISNDRDMFRGDDKANIQKLKELAEMS